MFNINVERVRARRRSDFFVRRGTDFLQRRATTYTRLRIGGNATGLRAMSQKFLYFESLNKSLRYSICPFYTLYVCVNAKIRCITSTATENIHSTHFLLTQAR